MIEENTVFILGAGASKPYGYLTGLELLDEVYWGTHYTNTDTGLYQELKRLSFDEKDIKEFNRAIYNSGENSIDSFLEYRDNDKFKRIGKIAMAYLLIRKEADSIHKFSVHSKDNDNFSVSKDNWYHYLYSTYLRTSFDDFNKNNFSVITFNYDRSFEQYLFSRLKTFGNSDSECAEKLSQINIIHLYGKLDDLPWENVDTSKRGYTSIAAGNRLIETSQRIRIIPEYRDVKKEISFQNANRLINKAERIIFLGLNLLNEKNLDRLSMGSYIDRAESKGPDARGYKILATSLNLKDAEKNRIREYFKGKIFLEWDDSNRYDKSNCTNFLRENVILK